jgi:putative ABC transport system substrate-binding protein
MNRRNLMTLLGGAAVWPVAARAQQPGLPVIGYLSSLSPDLYVNRLRAFRQGLGDTGLVEGRDVAIEYRWAEGQNDRLPSLAADLVRKQVNVLVAAGGTPTVLAANAATKTIPIVFAFGNDPVQLGLVASLKRPGGNLTGATVLTVELGPKRLELLHELVPTATIMALLVDPTNPNAETYSTSLQTAARALGLQLHVLHASTERDFATVFATLVQLRAGGLVIGPEQFYLGRSEQLAALAVQNAIPTITQYPEFAAAGGLMAYGGGDGTSLNRSVGVYAGRILKGEKPADLPVQQTTKVELIINLKTAKALCLTVPLTLLGRADEVIE